jgi:DNA-binding LacI/PurR family transcriptional regulator
MAFRCDALILLGPTMRAAELAGLARTTPTVVLARSLSLPGVDTVRTDDQAGAALATRHLIDLGHTKIVHVDGGRAPGAAERRRGYQRAMADAGLGRDLLIVKGGLNDTDGSAAAHHVLTERPETTAVAVFNDQSAFGFLATARSLGVRVPEDLSITGYDNTKISRSEWAQLTTVAQQSSLMAEIALDTAIARINRQEVASARLVGPLLIRRSTTQTVRNPG